MITYTRQDFYNEVKKRLSIDPATNDHEFWIAWSAAESGSAICNGTHGAKFNLYNTTWSLPGSTRYNSVGVRNYLSFTDGVVATVATLSLSYYSELVEACKDGAGLGHLANLLSHCPWGTGDAIWAGIDAVKKNPDSYRSIQIG